jgi:hypothetical protein
MAMRREQVSDFWHSQIAGGRQRILAACALD